MFAQLMPRSFFHLSENRRYFQYKINEVMRDSAFFKIAVIRCNTFKQLTMVKQHRKKDINDKQLQINQQLTIPQVQYPDPTNPSQVEMHDQIESLRIELVNKKQMLQNRKEEWEKLLAQVRILRRKRRIRVKIGQIKESMVQKGKQIEVIKILHYLNMFQPAIFNAGPPKVILKYALHVIETDALPELS